MPFFVIEALGRVWMFKCIRGGMKTSSESSGAEQEVHQEETVNHLGRRSLPSPPHPHTPARESLNPETALQLHAGRPEAT